MSTPKPLTIRDAIDADLPQVLALYEASGIDSSGSHDAESLAVSWKRLRTEAPTARVLLAERDGVARGAGPAGSRH